MSKSYKCGSGWSEWVVPDRPFWMYFKSIKKACKKHDKAYEKGGTEADRLQADIDLHDNILKIYRTSWLWRFKSYRERADFTVDTYLYFVQKFGKDKFNYTEKK